MKEKIIQYDGGTLNYTSAGEGKPVMLVHGFGEDSTVWEKQIAFLKSSYTLIVPDLPGSGKSTLLKKERIGMEDYAICLKKILEAENVATCIMIGHSMGGYITLAFAEKYPESLLAFGLFHSSAYADDAEKIATRNKGIAFITSNSAAAFLSTATPGLFFDAEKSKEEIDRLLEKGNNFTSEALIQYYHAMIARPDRTHILKQTALPVLLILGEHDKAVPFEQGLEQAKLADNTYIHVLRISGHMGMLEETEKSNSILADFLQTAGIK